MSCLALMKEVLCIVHVPVARTPLLPLARVAAGAASDPRRMAEAMPVVARRRPTRLVLKRVIAGSLAGS